MIKKDDIAVFYKKGQIEHTAIYNGDNSFKSKNGEEIFDESEDLKSLQKIYGDKVEFYTCGKNRILDNITKKPEDGKINLTEDEVYKMVREAKKRKKINRTNLIKKIFFPLSFLLSQNIFGQLSFVQDKDSCILLDGNFKLTSSLCNCDSLKNDTLLLIKTILNAAKDRWGSTLLYGYPYKPEDSSVYACSSTDCRNV